jgi:hypothetical protein
MCFNPSPERRVPSPNRYMAFARFCFCKNNKRTIIDHHGAAIKNPPALASQPDLAGPRAVTQGLIYARLCLMGDPSQRAALPPSDSRNVHSEG